MSVKFYFHYVHKILQSETFKNSIKIQFIIRLLWLLRFFFFVSINICFLLQSSKFASKNWVNFLKPFFSLLLLLHNGFLLFGWKNKIHGNTLNVNRFAQNKFLAVVINKTRTEKCFHHLVVHHMFILYKWLNWPFRTELLHSSFSQTLNAPSSLS